MCNDFILILHIGGQSHSGPFALAPTGQPPQGKIAAGFNTRLQGKGGESQASEQHECCRVSTGNDTVKHLHHEQRTDQDGQIADQAENEQWNHCTPHQRIDVTTHGSVPQIPDLQNEVAFIEIIGFHGFQEQSVTGFAAV